MKKQLLKEMQTWANLYVLYFNSPKFVVDNEIYKNVKDSWKQLFTESLFYLWIMPWSSNRLFVAFLNRNISIRQGSPENFLVDFIYSIKALDVNYTLTNIVYCSIKFSEFNRSFLNNAG